MESAGPLCDLRLSRPTKSTEAYFKMASVDQELNSWYSALPEDLKWTSENAEGMPPPYFLLQ
jgi:hypothetical protein